MTATVQHRLSVPLLHRLAPFVLAAVVVVAVAGVWRATSWYVAAWMVSLTCLLAGTAVAVDVVTPGVLRRRAVRLRRFRSKLPRPAHGSAAAVHQPTQPLKTRSVVTMSPAITTADDLIAIDAAEAFHASLETRGSSSTLPPPLVPDAAPAARPYVSAPQPTLVEFARQLATRLQEALGAPAVDADVDVADWLEQLLQRVSELATHDVGRCQRHAIADLDPLFAALLLRSGDTSRYTRKLTANLAAARGLLDVIGKEMRARQLSIGDAVRVVSEGVEEPLL